MQPSLASLPSEVIDQVLSYLSKQDLANLTVVSKRCSDHALARLWHEVDLEDCGRQRTSEDQCTAINHDDTKIVGKLLTIVRNDVVARHVQIINHRCHRHKQAIWSGLGRSLFLGQTMSYDPRLMKLVSLVSQRVKSLHTLRIVQGHPRLTEALMRCFFDARRQKLVPIRRLWLECCALSPNVCLDLAAHQQGLPTHLDFCGLESLRLRRIPLYAHDIDIELIREKRFPTESRTRYRSDLAQEWWRAEEARSNPEVPTDYFARANAEDDAMFSKLSVPQSVLDAHVPSHADRTRWAYRTAEQQLPSMSPATCSIRLLELCSRTLTSLTFDWAMIRPLFEYSSQTLEQKEIRCQLWLKGLFRLRLPALGAFQFRNCNEQSTTMDYGVALLDRCCWQQSACSPDHVTTVDPDEYLPLAFLEAHPQLRCLAWPIDLFFADPSEGIASSPRLKAVIKNLACTLTDLRLEGSYPSGSQEMYLDTENHTDAEESSTRRRRRRFIEMFVPLMTRLEDIKMRTGIPFDEKREILRALGRCSLQRISLVTQQSAVGNTWGEDGSAYSTALRGNEMSDLPIEDESAIRHAVSRGLAATLPPFRPVYGWTGQPAMLTTMSDYHHHSVRELKLVGGKGAVAVFDTSSITHAMLAGLQHFHNLESLTISMWISNNWERRECWQQIADFWGAAKSPSTTALTLRPQDQETGNAFQAYLNKLQSDRLADSIAQLLGRHLSGVCLRRRGGVSVRAKFAMARADFELDLRIGCHATDTPCLLEYEDIRRSDDTDRRRRQLRERRWF